MRMRTIRGKLRHRRMAGAEILEVALCLPILLLVAFGTVQFGYQFYLMHTLHSAAREGARAACPPGSTTTDVTNAIDGVMKTGGFKSGTDYDYTVSPSINPGTGSTLTVTVTFKKSLAGMRPLSGYLGKSSQTYALPTASVAMRKE